MGTSSDLAKVERVYTADAVVQLVSFLSQPAHRRNIFLRIFGYGCINQKPLNFNYIKTYNIAF